MPARSSPNTSPAAHGVRPAAGAHAAARISSGRSGGRCPRHSLRRNDHLRRTRPAHRPTGGGPRGGPGQRTQPAFHRRALPPGDRRGRQIHRLRRRTGTQTLQLLELEAREAAPGRCSPLDLEPLLVGKTVHVKTARRARGRIRGPAWSPSRRNSSIRRFPAAAPAATT